MDVFGKEYHLKMLAESISQWFKVLNAISDVVFKRKCLMGKLYFI